MAVVDLYFLAHMDLISRVHGLIRTIEFSTIRKRRKRHRKTDIPRGAVDIGFMMPRGTAPIDAERMLRRYGVPVWDRRLCGTEKVNGMKMHRVAMKVPASQVEFARYLMGRYGVALDASAPKTAVETTPEKCESGLPRPWSQGPRPARAQPQPARRKQSLRERLSEWL